MYGAVREDENTQCELTALDVKDEAYFSEVEVPYEITDADKVKVKDGLLKAKKDNAECTLTFEGIPGCETYLYSPDLRDNYASRCKTGCRVFYRIGFLLPVYSQVYLLIR